ncbi:MAG: dockerin type I domain-containing protein [Planctomycetota bacterium]
MCNKTLKLSVRFAVILAAGTVAAAEDFSIDWWTVGGGGEMWTTGGDYELSGTVGQSGAGVAMTGGDYSLSGGFWPGIPAYGRGDMNCDGNINAYDIDGFICALSPTCDYEGMFPDCNRQLADCNGDGDVNAYDIDTFIMLVGGG